MHSTDCSSVLGIPSLLSEFAGIQHCLDLLGAARGSGGKQRGCAMLSMCSAALMDSFEAAVHEIAATATMNMDVHEAGAYPPTLGIDNLGTLGNAALGLPHVRNLAVSAQDDRLIDGAVGQDGRPTCKAEVWQRVFPSD